MSPFEDNEDSLEKDESDYEEMVSSESLSDTKNSFLDFFFVDDLPEISSFNEQLQVNKKMKCSLNKQNNKEEFKKNLRLLPIYVKINIMIFQDLVLKVKK